VKRKPVVAGVVVVVALLGIGAAWKLGCSGGGSGTSSSSSGSGGAAGLHGSGRANTPRVPAAPASVAGRVTRKTDGAGVAGAVVALARAELGAMFLPNDTPTIVVITDAQGAWTVPQIAQGTYTIAATANGFLPGTIAKFPIAAGAHRTGVDMVLDAGGTLLHGTVTDIGGGGIGGARVTAKRGDDMGLTVFPELVALAGTDGKYQLTLPDGSFEVTASHDDYTKTKRYIELAGQPVTADFVLTPGGSIRGVVVSRDNKPVPGALVQAKGRHATEHDQAISDADGKFTLRSLGPGELSLTAAGRGYASTAPTVVELGIGEQADNVRVIVDRAFSISGRVVRKGKPTEGIPGVQLGLFTFQGEQAVALEPSADDGFFEILGVKPASYMLFAIGGDAVIELGKQVEVVDKDVTGIVLEMSRGARLSGRVEPGVVAAISIELEPGKIGLANMFDMVKTLLVKAESDVSGVFALENVPPGVFTLVAKHQDGRTGKLAITVTDAPQDGLVVKLEPRAAFAGRVIDANGAPVAGVHVSASAPRDDAPMMIDFNTKSGGSDVTAPNGAFRIVGLDAGKVEVSVSDDAGTLAWANPAHKDKPQEPITFDLVKAVEKANVTLTVEARDGVIRGVVIGSDKKPASDAWVTVTLDRINESKDIDYNSIMAEGDRAPVLTNADGKFTLDHLRHGTYTIVVEGPRGTSRATKEHVKIGETVTIALEPLGTLSGRVTIGSVPVALYDIACDGPTEMHRRITAADGAYTLERLAPGKYKCSVSADGGNASSPIDVPAGPAKLDLVLSAWGAVSGTVVNAMSGSPIAGLRVMAGNPDTDPQAYGEAMLGKGPVTDANGRFVVEHQAAGKGHLVVMPKDGGFMQLAEKEYTLTASQRLDLGTIKVIPPRVGGAGTLGLSTDVTDGKLVVAIVKDGGPADTAGVKVGDRIATIDGSPVTDPEIGKQMLASGSVGENQVVRLGLDRAGTAVQLVVTAVKW
jgi:hypothetical protein